MTDTIADTPMLAMNDGRAIPALGLGTYQIPDAQVAAVVRHGLDLGYRLVDTAAFYSNERGVGEALKGADGVFVTTKLWRDRLGYDSALQAFEESLALLGRESIDLYLIHWPVPSAGSAYVESWKALVRLREEGRAKSIGVSNFLPEHLERVMDATGVTPAVNQVELHPAFQQRELRAFHERHGIVTQSWSPLGQGSTLRLPVIREIAARRGATPAQVILAWHLQQGFSTIPKAGDPRHAADNFGALGVRLEPEDMAAIDALDDPDGRIGPHPLSM